jgi:mannose-6-phosphate isomerase
LRELHTDLALDAIDFEKKDDFMIKYSQKAGSRNLMVDCPYFQTNFLRLSEIFSIDLSGRDSFIIYMCVGGDATIANPEGSASINKGETVLISADTKVVDIQTTGAELLEVTI